MPRYPSDHIPIDFGSFQIDLSQQVAPQLYEQLKRKILSLELQPGDQISETALAQQAGVSRTPARQAIKDLIRENLLQSLPSRGTFISKIDTKRVTEALVVRRQLEPYLSAECAKQMERDELVASLKRTLDGHSEALDRKDSASAYQFDCEFHKLICTVHGDGLLWQFVLAARAEGDRLHALSKYRAENMKLALEQHWKILEAIEQGDSLKSEAMMRNHMTFNEGILDRTRELYPDVFAT
jgi:DNA-binding GntR family transcriptional regulator